MYVRKNKKGAGPLIATVLIIGMVVAGSAIVFLWGEQYSEELITKSQGAALSKLNCASDIKIDILRHDANTLTIENKGRGKIDAFTLIENDNPREDYTEIDPGNVEQVQYSGRNIVVIPKIRIAQGLYQPCTEQKLTYRI